MYIYFFFLANEQTETKTEKGVHALDLQLGLQFYLNLDVPRLLCLSHKSETS